MEQIFLVFTTDHSNQKTLKLVQLIWEV